MFFKNIIRGKQYFPLQFYPELSMMPKIAMFVHLLMIIEIKTFGQPPCPVTMTEGSFHSGKILASLDGGVLALQEKRDLQCYNYSLPYSFANVPEVAVAFHDFDMEASNNIFFYVKPILTQNKASISFVIRTQWFYTKWNRLTFNFLAEDRNDLESGYFQLDSGPLTSCHSGATIQTVLPFKKHYGQYKQLTHSLFLHGFQISTVPINYYSLESNNTPFDIQIGQSVASSSSITVQISVASPTQINSIYISYIVFETAANFDFRSGFFFYDYNLHNTMMFRPAEGQIKRSFAQIYGLTGFIIDHSPSKKLYLNTRWDGDAFQFDYGSHYNRVKYFSFQYLFFTGSQCDSCPGYPLSTLNGSCVNQCPKGSFQAPTGNFCITCGPGMMWSGSTCILACPGGQYYNNTTRSCQCPPTLNWNGNNCISCTGGKIWIPAFKSCDCPINLRWNGYTCAKLPQCTGGRIWDVYSYSCKCPDQMYWDGTCKQIPKCQGGQVLNQMKRCVCPNNFIWNGQTCAYTPCFGGQVWTGSNCVCPTGKNFNGSMCIQCINGQKWNSKLRLCECDSGYQWNGQYCEKNYECSGNRVWSTIYEQCICQDSFFWSGYACLPIPQCRGGQIWDSKILKCACLSGQRWSGIECILCTNGKIWNQYSFKCLCPPGTIQTNSNGGSCEVQQQCTGGKMWMQNTWSCQCPSSTVWNGNYCIVNPCKNGRMWSDQFKSCQCPSNKIWKNDACVPPQISCTNGRIWNQNIYACECPLRTYPTPSSCAPVTICINGKIYNPLSNKCTCPLNMVDKGSYCKDPDCPSDQYWNGYECTVIQCPPPSYFQNNRCIYKNSYQRTICSFGYIWNGRSCQFYPNSCPKGTEWNGNTCFSIGLCPRPKDYMNSYGKCDPLPQRCLPPTNWDGQACIYVSNSIGMSSKIVCPEGTYSSLNKCLPMVPCKGGHVWNSTFLKCVCPPNMLSNGKVCIQCPKDKIWNPKEGCICPQGKFDVGVSCEDITKTKCSIIQNSIWNEDKCLCRPGFTKIGFQCICFGIQSGSLCDKCSHKSNSFFNEKNEICECRQGFIDIDGLCVPAGKIQSFDDPKNCPVSTYFEYSQRMCLQCPIGCLSCENCYTCIMCRPQFQYNAKNSQCDQFCGDGKRFVLQCDDGNNQDGDGCSRDCKIEKGYFCNGGNPDRADSCKSYSPGEVTIVQTGQIRMQTSIVLNIQLNYLPQSLIQGPECKNSCENVIIAKIIKGDKSSLSITSKYISGTQFSFSITIQFGRPYIGQFSVEIAINSYLTHRYFDGINKMDPLTIDINPAYLALVSQPIGDFLT